MNFEKFEINSVSKQSSSLVVSVPDCLISIEGLHGLKRLKVKQSLTDESPSPHTFGRMIFADCIIRLPCAVGNVLSFELVNGETFDEQKEEQPVVVVVETA